MKKCLCVAPHHRWDYDMGDLTAFRTTHEAGEIIEVEKLHGVESLIDVTGFDNKALFALALKYGITITGNNKV